MFPCEDPTYYEFMTSDGSLAVEDYRRAIAFSVETLGRDWLIKEWSERLANGPSANAPFLRPLPEKELEENPLPALLCGFVAGARQSISEVFSLSRDCLATGAAPGVGEVHRRLRSSSTREYLGALFELNIGAMLVRGGADNLRFQPDTPDIVASWGGKRLLVEARKIGTYHPRLTANELLRSHCQCREGNIAFLHPFKGLFSINLRRSEVVLTARDLASEIHCEMLRAYEAANGGEFSIEGRCFDVQYDPATGERGMKIVFGRHDDYKSEVETIVLDALKRKKAKLQKGGLPQEDGIRVIALDCRSLLPIVPTWLRSFHADTAARSDILREAALDAVSSFVSQNPSERVVLLIQNPDEPRGQINTDWKAQSMFEPTIVVTSSAGSEWCSDPSEMVRALCR